MSGQGVPDRAPRSLRQVFPANAAVPFEEADAKLAAEIYRTMTRTRAREADIAIAATAIRHEAHLWTLNPKDFADIPGLSLWRPR